MSNIKDKTKQIQQIKLDYFPKSILTNLKNFQFKLIFAIYRNLYTSVKPIINSNKLLKQMIDNIIQRIRNIIS